MKIFHIISTILILSFSVYGQDKEGTLHYKSIDSNYTWRTASETEIDSFYFNIKPVKTSNNIKHIRIYVTSQIIDVFINEKNQYQGFLINKITEYKNVKFENEDYGRSVSDQIVFEKIKLNESLVKTFFQKIITSGQIKIPTDSLINNWNSRILHCSSIHFQFNINGFYKSQNYFCPWSQNETVIGKTTIVNNYNLVKNIFNLDSIYNDFENRLPKGTTYSRDGYMMTYKMNDAQIDNWENSKPKRDYMKSVKDTIDSYLNTKLSKYKVELKDISCFEDYRLIIGKKGKIREIYISEYDKPKLKTSLGLIDYLTDKKEIRKCKSKIREIFREIDLDFLNLQYEIYRTVNFNLEEEVILRDDTMY